MKRINQLIIEGTVDIVNNDIFELWIDDEISFNVLRLRQFKNIIKDRQNVRIVGKLALDDRDETVIYPEHIEVLP